VIARRLIDFFATPRPSAPVDAFPEPTEREHQILALLAQYQTNPQIARSLQLSPKTIRNHVSNVFAKLQVADRAEAVLRAQQAGLGANRPGQNWAAGDAAWSAAP
jgi:DNA-binding NarL/FixJ family response regulator